MDWTILGRKVAALGLKATGAALGGPTGAAIGQRIAGALNVEATPDAVSKAIVTDPDNMLALRKIEAELEVERFAHTERMADRDTVARNAQEENIREARSSTPDLNPLRAKLFLVMLAVLVLSILGLTSAWLWNDDFPEALFALIGTVIGMFVSKVGGGWDYFFGTSSGSAAKERTAVVERAVRDASPPTR